MNKKLKNILIVTVVTLSILVVLEVISRVVLSHVYDRSFDSSLIEKGKYGNTNGLKANASGTVWGKSFHTDDMGGRKHSKDKRGRPKLLIIGDSVTEGVGVDDSATFSNLLNNKTDSFDVRNISQIGWSTFDYRNAISQLIKIDSSINSVYLFYCLNDIYGKSSVKELPPMANKGLVSELNEFLQNRCATYQLIKLFCYHNSDHYYQYDRSLYLDNTRVNNVVTDLSYIKTLCEGKKITFMVILLPYKSQLDGRSDDRPQRILCPRLKKENILYADILKRFPHDKSHDDMYLFADEIHLSAIGHTKILTGIYEIQ